MRSPGRLLGPALFSLLGAALLLTAALGLDAVVICTAKVAARSAARSGALAGAAVLAADSRDAGGAARVAGAFAARRQPHGPGVVVGDRDIRVEPDRGEVEVTARSARRLPTLVAHFFAAGPLEVRAAALAEVVAGGSATCVRPWILADGFADAPPRDGRFGAGDSYHPGVTSWGTAFRGDARDRGRLLPLNLTQRPDDVRPGSLRAIDLRAPDDPAEPAAAYARHMARCPESGVSVGDAVRVLAGPLEEPTREAMRALIALDPAARWDDGYAGITGSAYPAGASPRIVRVTFFDPRGAREDSPAGMLTVVNIGALFIEKTPEGAFTGRLMNATGEPAAGAAASLTRSVRQLR